eukprot:COSAG04_NODE_4043_length_2346_cov_6.101024_1_plen_466_part_00
MEESVGWGKMNMGPAESEPREPEPEPEPQAPAGLPGEPEPEPEEGVPPEEVGYWEAEGIPGVVLYDEHTRSRQKGRLQITRSQLSFYPASGGGRPVSFPLESVQSAKRAEKGGRFKVEARVLVPRQEKPAGIAFEFDDRRRERDDALRAMSKDEDGLFGRQSLFDGAEMAAAAAAQTGEIRVGAVLRDSRRANRPEQVQVTLGTDKISFEPASGGGETATLTLAQLRRIKSSEADSGLFATATAGIDLVRGSISRLSGFTLGSAAAAPPPSSVELRFAIATDERAPKAICTLDFETDELRDQLVIQLQQRWSVVKQARAEAEAAAARDDFGLSVVSTAVRDVVPELVSIVSTLKTEGGTKGRYVVECEAGGGGEQRGPAGSGRWQLRARGGEMRVKSAAAEIHVAAAKRREAAAEVDGGRGGCGGKGGSVLVVIGGRADLDDPVEPRVELPPALKHLRVHAADRP